MKLLEKTIEDALIEYLNDGGRHIYLGRQVKFPMGIVDVLAFWKGVDVPCIFEVKRDKLKEKDIVQLMGYVHQLRRTIQFICEQMGLELSYDFSYVHGVIVCAGIDRELALRLHSSDEFDVWQYRQNADGGFSFIKVVPDREWLDRRMECIESVPGLDAMISYSMAKSMFAKAVEARNNVVIANTNEWVDKIYAEKLGYKGKQIFQTALRIAQGKREDIIWSR